MNHRKPPHDWAKTQGRNEMAGMDQGMRVLSYLIAGVLVYGALGWLGDHYLGTGFLLPIGIVLGAAGGCYVIIRRYGRDLSSSGGSADGEIPVSQPSPMTSGTTTPSTTKDSPTDQKAEGAR
jgi:F0F1-type ATP synthase assembly protein I